MSVRRVSGLVIALLTVVMTSCLDRPEIIDTQAQQAKDLETIDNYLASNGIVAIKDKAGIRYTFSKIGSGFPPRNDQTIKAKYVGKFLDGTVFDDGDPSAEGPLGTFILGWQYALPVWPVGSKGTLYVPSTLAYGSKQVNNVPPNAIVVFDIELTEVVVSNADKARFTADTTAIDDYLEKNNIVAEKDSTGVRYVITEPGAGAKPGLFSKVKFNYKGIAIASGTEFFNGTTAPNEAFDSRVIDYLNGLKVGLMKLAVGGKAKLYIPSALAFGPNEIPSSGLPANSNVMYEIELTEIVP